MTSQIGDLHCSFKARTICVKVVEMVVFLHVLSREQQFGSVIKVELHLVCKLLLWYMEITNQMLSNAILHGMCY